MLIIDLLRIQCFNYTVPSSGTDSTTRQGDVMPDKLDLPFYARLKLRSAASWSSRTGKPVSISIYTGIQQPAMPFSLSLFDSKAIPESVRRDFESELRDLLTQRGTPVNDIEVELYWKPWGISISSLWYLLRARISLS